MVWVRKDELRLHLPKEPKVDEYYTFHPMKEKVLV